MSKLNPSIIADQISGVLGTNDAVEVGIDDPSIVDIVGHLRKAKVMLELCHRSISIVYPTGTDQILKIYRVGAPVSAAGSDSTSRVQKPAPPISATGGDHAISDDASTNAKPAKRPEPKRYEHAYRPPAFLRDVIDVLADDASLLVWFSGPTGCGKSSAARYIARAMGRTLFEISSDGNMETPELLGFQSAKKGEVVWVPGVIEQAMTCGLDEHGNEVGAPGILLLDEAAALPPEAAHALNRVLESDDPRRKMVLNADGGRVVRSHSQFRIIFSANTFGRGANTTGQALHTAQMSALDFSFISRIAFGFEFGYDQEAEKRILQDKIGDDRVAKKVLEVRDGMRELIRKGQMITPFGTRNVIDIANGYRIFGDLGKAIYHSVVVFLMEEEKPTANEVVQRIVGTDVMAHGRLNGYDYM